MASHNLFILSKFRLYAVIGQFRGSYSTIYGLPVRGITNWKKVGPYSPQTQLLHIMYQGIIICSRALTT